MITTGCEGCCFLKNDNKSKKCIINQACALKDGKAFAPGYCRMCRSHGWAKKQGKADLQQLGREIINERALTFDMLIFFDEAYNGIKDLEKTLDSNWHMPYAKKIIIMDVTGFGERQNLAMQYVNSREHAIPTVVDSSALHEPITDRGRTIKRVSRQVKSPFFLVVPAGNIVSNFDKFANMVQHLPSRVIHWLFPFVRGSTAIAPYNLDHGLFITKPYRAIMQSVDVESFTDQLKKEEKETNMGLSWFCSDCWLT